MSSLSHPSDDDRRRHGVRTLRAAPAPAAHLPGRSTGVTGPATGPVVLRLWAVPEVVRVGLETMLAQHAGRVCLQAAGAAARPHVTLVDPLALEAAGIPDAAEVPVVALTWDTSPRGVARARALGAVRIVPVSVGVLELIEVLDGVRRTAAAEAGRTPSVPRSDDHWSPEGLLSGREAQILERICRGMSNDEIAAELYLSINSVKTYIRTAYRKIGVTRRPRPCSGASSTVCEHGPSATGRAGAHC